MYILSSLHMLVIPPKAKEVGSRMIKQNMFAQGTCNTTVKPTKKKRKQKKHAEQHAAKNSAARHATKTKQVKTVG